MKKVLKGFLSLWFVAFLLCIASASAQDQPKNVILLIGDGMGPDHVQAARLMAGGELAMDRLDDAPGLVTTFNFFGGITDSAAAATALATGVKTANGNISMDWKDEIILETVLERAEAYDKATGLVSNINLQDATPGVWAAHWHRRDGIEIALQQAEAMWAQVEVFLGSGRYYMLPKGKYGGSRRDGRNLIEEMIADGYLYVDTVDELNAVEDISGYTGLLGIFGSIWTIEYVLDRDSDPKNSPSLPEMAAKAIDVLSDDPDGFFLMIEGGAIDWMGHNRDVAGVVAETLEFDACVQLALDFASADGNTLVIVTADHETGALDSEGLDLDFLSGITRTTEFMWGLIKKEHMQIEDVMETYAGITDLTDDELHMIEDYGEGGISDVLSARAGVAWGWSGSDNGSHTLTPVEVYAYGPGADQLDGFIDNTDIGILLFVAVMGGF